MKLSPPARPWYGWQKVLFRFFFLFYCFFEGPWSFLYQIPKADVVFQYWFTAQDAVVLACNRLFFHISPAKVPPNGNGDYPEQWMLVCTALLLAAVGSALWSILDRKRSGYSQLNYWFSLGVRYLIIMNGINYGLVKIFGLQMPFPSLSQLATPLGDYLPMRFSWMFVGYSPTYQAFSGAIEFFAALLLLFRRTATLGVLVATAVFLNVMMLNLSYDIPVKINSISLVVLCFYLLVQEMPRLYRFFFLNEARESGVLLFPFETKRRRRIALLVKCLFVALVLYNELDSDLSRLAALHKRKSPSPVTAGIYDVLAQAKVGDTITARMPDSVYWQNIVFDRGYEGSIKTADRRFRQRYGRSYFVFEIDSAARLLSLKRSTTDSVYLARFSYNFKDSGLVELSSYPRQDSLYLLLRKRATPFPLEERPFHWVSETNR